MKKNDQKIMIIVLICAIVVLVIFMFLQGLIIKPHFTKDNSTEIGSITQTAEDYDPTQEYEWSGDEVIDYNVPIITNIENVNLIFDHITLQATQQLDTELTAFLLKNGYDENKLYTLSITPSTIVEDRSYPYFEMTIKEDGNVIKAYYDLPTYKWVFEFKENIF